LAGFDLEIMYDFRVGGLIQRGKTPLVFRQRIRSMLNEELYNLKMAGSSSLV
jgi:hypothetical protein